MDDLTSEDIVLIVMILAGLIGTIVVELVSHRRDGLASLSRQRRKIAKKKRIKL